MSKDRRPSSQAIAAKLGTARAGLAVAAASAVAFGTLSIIAKYAYEAGADPLPLLAVRFAIAAALIAVFLVATGRSVRVPRPITVRLILLGAVGYGIESSLFFMALQHTTAGVVGLVFYSYPVWTTIAAIAFGLERFRVSLVFALTLSTLGVLLIFSIPQGDMTGPLLALASSIFVSAYFIAAQMIVKNVDSTVAAFWTSAGAAVSIGVAGLAASQSFPSAALPSAALLGTVTAVAFILMYAALVRIGSSRFAVAATLEPVTTIVFAAVLLGDDITLRIAAGAVLVVSALPILASSSHPDTSIPAADSI